MLQPAPVQTTYQQYLNAGQVGMIASEFGWDIDTRICEDPAGNGVGFGLGVSQGTLHGDRSAALGALSGFTFLGVTVADQTLSTLTFTDKYADTDNMAVLVKGDIWVAVANAVTPEGDVYYNNTTGAFGATSGSSTKVANAKWMTTQATVGGLAVLRLTQATPTP